MLAPQNAIVDDAPRARLGVTSDILAVTLTLGQKTCITVADSIPTQVLALSTL